MLNLKTEVTEEEQASTSEKRKGRKSDETEKDIDTEDSSDGENSVIILDSDTEADTDSNNESEDGDDNESEEEDGDEEDEDEEDEDSDEEFSDEESADSSDSDSVWSNIDEALDDNITSEAAEARIIRKFEKAIIQIADKNTEKGKKTLEKLLKTPSIAIHHKNDTDFENIEEPTRLSKLLQIFIAIHKNLAIINSESCVEHFLQILAYQPNNTSIWFDVAMKCVENADLEFAKYAFKKCENEKDSIEAHATVLFMTCDFKGCLEVLKRYQEDVGELNDKMKYLKFKIRTTNSYYRQMSDMIFEEDEIYAELKQLDLRKTAVFDDRFEDLRARTFAKSEENNKSIMKRIPIEELKLEIPADMNLETVCTLFCDVYDRIENYSNMNDHLVKFEEWENRRDFLEIREAMDEMLDIVENVEEMTEKVSLMPYSSAKKPKKSTKEYLSTWKRRLFVDKPIEEEQETDNNDEGNESVDEEDDVETVSSEASCQPENPNLPFCDLAESFGLSCSHIIPIVSARMRIERTPPPSEKCDFLNEDVVLDELRMKFEKKSCTIIDNLECALLLISKHSPNNGALPKNMHEVVREMYTRISNTSRLEGKRFELLNVMMMELEHPRGVDVCMKRYLSYWHTSESEDSEADIEEDGYGITVPTAESIKKMKNQNRTLILRFHWKFLNWEEMNDETRLEHLYEMKTQLEEKDESIHTVYGKFGLSDVMYQIEDLEKKKRIESVKLLWKSKSYADIADIIENDIDFTVISIDETIEMLTFWLKSLEKLKNMEKFASLTIRLLHFYVISDFRDYKDKDRIEVLAQDLVKRMLKIDFGSGKIGVELISSLGYFLCLTLKHFKSLEENWKNWKVLYRIVKAMRDIPLLEYFTTLDRADDGNAMPSPDLDVLVKAHEVLAEAKKCGCENYDFLLFFVDEIRRIVDDIPVLEALFEKENVWLWTNLNQELAQCLFCLFGKYSKKRRFGEDHGSKSSCPTDWKIAKRVLTTVLVQPLPMYDDKDRLTHDVVDLISSKFEFMLKVSDEKALLVERFQENLKASISADVHTVENWLNDDEAVVEEDIQSLVWYALALHSYRQGIHEDALKYSELYLTTQDSMSDDRLRASAWAILAHEHVHELFLLESAGIISEWKWRMTPFRIAIELLKNEANIHFEMAANMYQLASEQCRFLTTLPFGDLRRKRIGDVEKLRIDARVHFDICLSLAQPSADGTPPEFQWLCYFFIGKLIAKEENCDVVKVVECFYEAACGCQLAGFYYPIKINPKKQTNFEPLEVHYQAYSAVWKYLHEADNPPLQTLLDLQSYLKCFENGHKVVKCSYSMFSTPPEIYQTCADAVSQVVADEHLDVDRGVVDQMIDKLELVEELKQVCYKAFLLICERFPHIKSHYRLAQYYIENESFEQASDQIFKNVFRRKKRDDGIFDNVVEIACNDINRSGSYCFHIERCLRLGIGLAAKLNDIHNLVSILSTLITAIGFEEDQFVEKRSFHSLTRRLLVAIEKVCDNRPKSSRNTPSPPIFVRSSTPPPIPIPIPKRPKSPNNTSSVIRSELWRLWNAISKQDKTKNEKLLKFIQSKVEIIVSKVYGSVRALKEKVVANQELMQGHAKKKMALKRKAAFDAEAMVNNLVASAKKTIVSTVSTISQQPSTSRDDVIVIEDDEIEVLPTSSSKPTTSNPRTFNPQSSTNDFVKNPQLLQEFISKNPQIAKYLASLNLLNREKK